MQAHSLLASCAGSFCVPCGLALFWGFASVAMPPKGKAAAKKAAAKTKAKAKAAPAPPEAVLAVAIAEPRRRQLGRRDTDDAVERVIAAKLPHVPTVIMEGRCRVRHASTPARPEVKSYRTPGIIFRRNRRGAPPPPGPPSQSEAPKVVVLELAASDFLRVGRGRRSGLRSLYPAALQKGLLGFWHRLLAQESATQRGRVSGLTSRMQSGRRGRAAVVCQLLFGARSTRSSV